MLLLRECLPRKSHKGVEAPYCRSLQMHQVYEMCRSLPTMGNADSTLAFEEPCGSDTKYIAHAHGLTEKPQCFDTIGVSKVCHFLFCDFCQTLCDFFNSENDSVHYFV